MTENIEIHIVSNRPMLDEFIDMWKDVKVHKVNCTIKVLMLDYPEKKFVLSNGIKVEYIKQKSFPVTSFMNQSWARNELLCYTTSEYVLFYDDWQRPGKNILKEHLHYLTKDGKDYAVCGRRMECNKDGNDCQEDGRIGNGKLISCGYGLFWTCNASARTGDILKVNGFDNRYNGGSGGEDYDMGMRLERLGNKMIYNPDAKAYHYCHDHLKVGRPSDGRYGKDGGHSHDLGEYKYLPEYKHFGNWNLMDGGDLYEFWWEGPIKYYRCKRCGIVGILDSIQVYYYNRDNNIIKVENGLEQVRGMLNR
jgi:hypothetical protein